MRVSGRLAARVRRDFEPEEAAEVLAVLEQVEFPLWDLQDKERILTAVVLLAHGRRDVFDRAVELGRRDWRDLLVAAGLANGDWPRRLDRELGPRGRA